jgi:hypothetical protein
LFKSLLARTGLTDLRLIFECRHSDFKPSPTAADRRAIRMTMDSWVALSALPICRAPQRAAKHNGGVVLLDDREVKNSMT